MALRWSDGAFGGIGVLLERGPLGGSGDLWVMGVFGGDSGGGFWVVAVYGEL